MKTQHKMIFSLTNTPGFCEMRIEDANFFVAVKDRATAATIISSQSLDPITPPSESMAFPQSLNLHLDLKRALKELLTDGCQPESDSLYAINIDFDQLFRVQGIRQDNTNVGFGAFTLDLQHLVLNLGRRSAVEKLRSTCPELSLAHMRVDCVRQPQKSPNASRKANGIVRNGNMPTRLDKFEGMYIGATISKDGTGFVSELTLMGVAYVGVPSKAIAEDIAQSKDLSQLMKKDRGLHLTSQLNGALFQMVNNHEVQVGQGEPVYAVRVNIQKELVLTQKSEKGTILSDSMAFEVGLGSNEVRIKEMDALNKLALAPMEMSVVTMIRSGAYGFSTPEDYKVKQAKIALDNARRAATEAEQTWIKAVEEQRQKNCHG
jgi:hypothetical protein